MSSKRFRFRWIDGLPPTAGRLWRILYLANGNIVTYEEISRRLWGDHISLHWKNSLWYHVKLLRQYGFIILTVDEVGLRLKD